VIKFEKVRPGKYRAELEQGSYIWISRQSPHHWWWWLGDESGRQEVWADNNGPFQTVWKAIADAIAKYKGFENTTIVWYVHLPEGWVKSPCMWRLKPVISGSELDLMLALPGEWHRFPSRADAEAWLRAESRLQWD